MAATEPAPKPSLRGRPVATTHGEIEQAAFRLFAERGFERTTLDAIATETGIGRRTLFRYFESKNDIPWGRFDRTLDGFRDPARAGRTSCPCTKPSTAGWSRSTTSTRPPYRHTASGCG